MDGGAPMKARMSCVILLPVFFILASCSASDQDNLWETRIIRDCSERFCSSDGWCWSNPLPGGNPINDAWGPENGERVYLVGDHGTVLVSDGSEICRLDIGTTHNLNAIFGSSENDIWIAGEQGLVVQINGTTATHSIIDESIELIDVWASSPRNAYAYGNRILYRFDGSSWSPERFIQSHHAQIWGSGPNDIYVVGRGHPYHFDGSTWRQIGIGAGVNDFTTAIWGTGPNEIWISGTIEYIHDCNGYECQISSESRLWHYNGSWIESSTFPTFDSGAGVLWGTGPTNLWATFGNSLYHSDGVDWVRSEHLLPGLSAIWGLREDELIMAGDVISVTNGHEISEITRGFSSGIGDFWGTSSDDLWASGHEIVHFDGVEWSVVDTGPEIDFWITDIAGFSSSDIYGVGHNDSYESRIVHYDGLQWELLTDWSAQQIFGITEFPSLRQIVAVGARGHVMRFDGISWSEEDAGTEADLHSVWGTSPNELFAVGYTGRVFDTEGTLLRYAGDSWEEVEIDTPGQLNDVWGSSQSDVFVVGGSLYEPEDQPGRIFHYDGSSWSEMDVGIIPPLFVLWGDGPDNVYAAGSEGFILHYDGMTWTPIESGTSLTISALWGDDRGQMFAGGHNRLVLEYR